MLTVNMMMKHWNFTINYDIWLSKRKLMCNSLVPCFFIAFMAGSF